MDDYTRRVMRRGADRGPGFSLHLIMALLWQLGGVVALVFWDRSSFTLVQLQWIFGIVALVVGGLESNAFGGLFGVLPGARPGSEGAFWIVVFCVIGSLFDPRVALFLWAFGVVRYALVPSVFPVAASWYALVVVARGFELFQHLPVNVFS